TGFVDAPGENARIGSDRRRQPGPGCGNRRAQPEERKLLRLKGGSNMAQAARNISVRAEAHDPVYQAYQILHVGFTIAPILAGVDKFLHLLVNWDQYLAPIVSNLLGGHG